MELELIRTYYLSGTNGKILFSGCLMMYSIELPWEENRARVSCIPEGKYELVKRWSPKFNRHLQLMDVPQRESIRGHYCFTRCTARNRGYDCRLPRRCRNSADAVSQITITDDK